MDVIFEISFPASSQMVSPQQEHLLMTDQSGSRVRHHVQQQPPIATLGSQGSASLPRRSQSGQRTLLLQAPTHGILRNYSQESHCATSPRSTTSRCDDEFINFRTLLSLMRMRAFQLVHCYDQDQK